MKEIDTMMMDAEKDNELHHTMAAQGGNIEIDTIDTTQSPLQPSVVQNYDTEVGNKGNYEQPNSDALSHVNDRLEVALVETKNAVKRILKELVALQDVATTVQEQWTPLQAAEHEEATRLDELQTEVDGATKLGTFDGGTMNLMMKQQNSQAPITPNNVYGSGPVGNQTI